MAQTRYKPFKHVKNENPHKYKSSDRWVIFPHDFIVSQVNTNWRAAYYGRNDDMFENPEHASCDRWLKDNMLDVWEWLQENNVEYQVRSSGDSWFDNGKHWVPDNIMKSQCLSNFNMIKAANWTVAVIGIVDEADALLFKMRFC